MQNDQGGAFLMFCCTTRWLSLRLDLSVALYITLLSFAFIPLSQSEQFSNALGLTPGTGKLGFFLGKILKKYQFSGVGAINGGKHAWASAVGHPAVGCHTQLGIKLHNLYVFLFFFEK